MLILPLLTAGFLVVIFTQKGFQKKSLFNITYVIMRLFRCPIHHVADPLPSAPKEAGFRGINTGGGSIVSHRGHDLTIFSAR